MPAKQHNADAPLLPWEGPGGATSHQRLSTELNRTDLLRRIFHRGRISSAGFNDPRLFVWIIRRTSYSPPESVGMRYNAEHFGIAKYAGRAAPFGCPARYFEHEMERFYPALRPAVNERFCLRLRAGCLVSPRDAFLLAFLATVPFYKPYTTFSHFVNTTNAVPARKGHPPKQTVGRPKKKKKKKDPRRLSFNGLSAAAVSYGRQPSFILSSGSTARVGFFSSRFAGAHREIF